MFKSLGKYIKNSFSRFDKPVLIFSMLITLMSIVTIFSARENFGNSKFIMQLAMTIVGICAIMVLVNLDYRIFVERYWKILWIISVALLGITLILGDTGANGTETSNKSWLTIIKIGSRSFQIQPSEFVKIAFIISFSKHLTMVKDKINKVKTLIPLAIHAGVIVGLILLSGDLGVTLVYVGIIAIMLAFAGLSFWYFAGALGVVVIAFPFLWPLLSKYQQMRILVGFQPELDPTGYGFQPLLSLDAISAGGIFGRGMNSGGYYEILPASHTDFIFSTYCEMFGFIGALIFLVVLFLLIMRLIRIAKHCRNDFGSFICIGIAGMFIVQSVMNIGMCLAMFPVIGITLPFMSYGGSSMLALYIAMGFVHAISAHDKGFKRKKVVRK
ncbi:MAG: FtsW/RodA/SpoVE family cell cycle protein [Clostridia bacterium]|nr:FtsW/RodA/SpoVE family cell cycle protein [Clostridia bacterium]